MCVTDDVDPKSRENFINGFRQTKFALILK